MVIFGIRFSAGGHMRAIRPNKHRFIRHDKGPARLARAPQTAAKCMACIL